jgi:hypothetical protein
MCRQPASVRHLGIVQNRLQAQRLQLYSLSCCSDSITIYRAYLKGISHTSWSSASSSLHFKDAALFLVAWTTRRGQPPNWGPSRSEDLRQYSCVQENVDVMHYKRQAACKMCVPLNSVVERCDVDTAEFFSETLGVTWCGNSRDHNLKFRDRPTVTAVLPRRWRKLIAPKHWYYLRTEKGW